MKFELIEEARKNQIYIKLTYMSGDADAYEYEEIFTDIPFDNYSERLKEIEDILKPYILLSKITDCNSVEYLEDPDDVKEKHGEDIADLFDMVPGDSTCDGQRNTHLCDIKLIGYDHEGNCYQTYIL